MSKPKKASSSSGINASGTSATLPGSIVEAFTALRDGLKGVATAQGSAHKLAKLAGESCKVIRDMDKRKDAFKQAWANVVGEIAGLSAGSLKTYKVTARQCAGIPSRQPDGTPRKKAKLEREKEEKETAGSNAPADAVEAGPYTTRQEMLAALVEVFTRCGAKSEADCIGFARAAWAKMPRA
jgi:hypothetical protein